MLKLKVDIIYGRVVRDENKLMARKMKSLKIYLEISYLLQKLIKQYCITEMKN